MMHYLLYSNYLNDIGFIIRNYGGRWVEYFLNARRKELSIQNSIFREDILQNRGRLDLEW